MSFTLRLVEVVAIACQSRHDSWRYLVVEIVAERIIVVLKHPRHLRPFRRAPLFRTAACVSGRSAEQHGEATEDALHGAHPPLLSALAFQLDGVYRHASIGLFCLLLVKRLPVFRRHVGVKLSAAMSGGPNWK